MNHIKTVETIDRISYLNSFDLDAKLNQAFQAYANNTALLFNNEEMTYNMLNNHVDRLAKYITNKNYKNVPIGFCMNRGFNNIIAMLAILRSNCFYVPLDKSYPLERIRFIIEDTNLPLILTDIDQDSNGELYELLRQKQIMQVNLEQHLINQDCNNKINCDIKIDDENVKHSESVTEKLAYIIYTSGTTGTPKGVMIERHSLLNLIQSAIRILNVNEEKLLHYASIGFDAAGWDIYISLLSGSCLCIANEKQMISPIDCHSLMLEHKINFATVTPAFLAQMPLIKVPSLRILIVMGDMADSKNMNFWCGSSVNGSDSTTTVYNGYGPTETTIGATIHKYSVGDSAANIGSPFDNYTIYLLDDDLNETKESNEINKACEMCIGGIGVARGYWNQAELTKKKFVDTKYGRLYRTGDLAKRTLSNEYLFVGRKDNQIKINGIRIELEEIESLIANLPYIVNTAVIYDRDEKILIVYYSQNLSKEFLTRDVQLTQNNIKAHLSKYLHRAVVPQHYQLVENFILNANGKIDKKQLPKYVRIRKELQMASNEFEQILIDAFKEVLSLDDEIGANSNFLELGGDSLKVARVVEVLRDNFYDVDVLALFKYPIIADLAKHVVKLPTNVCSIESLPNASLPNISLLNASANLEIDQTINDDINQKSYDMNDLKNDEQSNKKFISLTPYQLGMWRYQQIYPDDPSYNTLSAFSLQGDLDVNKLENVLRIIIDGSKALRTKITVQNDNVLQYFDSFNNNEFKLHIEQCYYNDIMSIVKQDVETPFEMSNCPLMKIRLFKVSDHSNMHILTMIKHNIIVDAYSEGLILKSIQTLYNSKESYSNSNSIEKNDYYVDYIEHVLNSFKNSHSIDYFKTHLASCPTINLPKREIKSLQKKNGICIKTIHVPNMQIIIKQLRTTSYNLLLAAFNILLWRYSQSTDIVVGTQIAARHDPKYLSTIGFMVSTLAIRTKFDHKTTVLELLDKIKNNVIDAISNRFITYDEISKLCGNKIDAMFVLQNTSQETNEGLLQLNGIDVKPLEIESFSNAFPLYFDLYPNGDRFKIRIRYSDVFDPIIVEQMLNCYELIVNDILDNFSRLIEQPANLRNVDTTVGDIKYLTRSSKVIGHEIKIDQTIDKAVFKQCANVPKNVAIKYSTNDNNHLDSSLSYHTLNRVANKTARCLIDNHNICPGDVVAVKMNRSKDFVVLILAILKIGACYVPIDPNFPSDRIEYMIDDCKPKLMIVSNNKEMTKFNSTKILHYNELRVDANLASDDNISLSQLDSVAYMIYTSGSTGKPKCCIITHEAIVNVLTYFRTKLNINQKDRVWFLTTISFDIMVLELFLPLISGAQLLICPACVSSNPVTLTDWINREKPTLLQATPTLFSLIGDHIEERKDMVILVGGEAITTKIAKTLSRITNKVYNVYGPSETTIWSTCKKVESIEEITIGKPISNTSCIVLNENKQIVPHGCVGELYIGGIGVSKGYLNRPDLNIQKFILYSYFQEVPERFYKTGDLVRLNADDEFEYIGRTDFQVKIRGHRIELEEIISVMEQHSSVKRATVVVRENNGNIFLVAYFVGTSDDTIIDHLRSNLPQYMVPNFTIQLPRFPETLNGKIDSNLLPNPFDPNNTSNIAYINKNEFVAPRDELEQVLHDIFVDVIGCKDISILDSIFNVGATSIMFPEFVKKINKELGKQISIEQFIKNSTVELCAKLLRSL